MPLKTGMRCAVGAVLSICIGFVSGAEAGRKATSEEIAERLAFRHVGSPRPSSSPLKYST